MIRIALIDDDIHDAGSLEELLYEVSSWHNILIEIDVFLSNDLKEHSDITRGQYDVFYICIQEQELALKTAKKIRTYDDGVLMAYITYSNIYIPEILELKFSAYILKPIDTRLFEKYFLLMYEKTSEENRYFIFHYKNEMCKILVSEIIYFESRNRQIFVHICDSEVEIFNGKLADIEKKLQNTKSPFLRVHQSFLVSFRMVRAHSKTRIRMINGDILPISDVYQKNFCHWYGKLVGEDAIEYP